MKRILIFSVFLLFAVFTISQVSSTRCYNCNSIVQSECSSPMNVSAVQQYNCTQGDVCLKATGTASGGASATIRTCWNRNSNCSEVSNYFANFPASLTVNVTQCTFCETDLCNDDSKPSVPTTSKPTNKPNNSVMLSGEFFSIFPVMCSYLITKKFFLK